MKDKLTINAHNNFVDDSNAREILVVKIGGNIVDNDEKLSTFLQDFANIAGPKILVHGGGKLATKLAEKLNIPQQLVDGRRITDEETLKIVTMVYAGLINKTIVAKLQSFNCDSIGLSGADGNLIIAEKRKKGDIDYGFAGDVKQVNNELIKTFLDKGLAIVIAPITHNGKGQLLNTNADTIAQEVAKSLGATGKVTLIYSFEKPGVLTDANDDTSLIPVINQKSFKDLKEQKIIFEGMIPKLENAFAALESGVDKVIIGKAEFLESLIKGGSGTSIVME